MQSTKSVLDIPTTKITINQDGEAKRVWGRVAVFQLQVLSDRPSNMAAAVTVTENVHFTFVRDDSTKKEIKRLVINRISPNKT